MKLIVAVNNLGYIGRDGKLLTKCKADMQHFKQITTSNVINQCIVGRKTYEECIGMRGLPGRSLWVVGGHGHHTLYEAVASCLQDCSGIGDKISTWVIGGSEIYKQLLPLCTEIHISHIDDDTVGDVSFTIPEGYRGQVFHYYFKPDNYHDKGTGTKEVESNQGNVTDEQSRGVIPTAGLEGSTGPGSDSKKAI